MVIPYILNENWYVISSFADPNNPLFTNQEEIEDFKKRVNKHLGKICEIMGYTFHTDHYQILVYILDREKFVKFYNEKHGVELKDDEIMDSTYIFSQQIANILSGFAKRFNFFHNRYGALFGRRFTKILIKTEAELAEWTEKMKRADRLWSFEKLWSYIKNFVKQAKKLKKQKVGLGIKTEAERVAAVVDEVLGSMFVSWEAVQLRGRYVGAPLPPHLAEKLR
jgi:hypothetical protein